VFDLLKKFSHIILKSEVQVYEFDENQFRIKMELELIDHSKLIIKDYRFSNHKRKYAYHWMNSNGDLRIRWDNAPHWENISTFPHHRHVKSLEEILPSTETDTESILNFIKNNLHVS